MLGQFVALMFAVAPPDIPAAPTAPAAAAETQTPSPAAEAPARKKRSGSDVICRDVTPVGTRFSKRVCATRADLEERSRRDQEFIRTVRTAPTPAD